MRTFFLHLGLACVTFSLSSHFTKVWRGRPSEALPCEASNELPLTTPDRSTGEVNLLDIYRDYAAAQTRHDQAFFERVEDEEFRLFTTWGSFSRTEDIQMMNHDSPDIVYKIEDLNVESKGEAAIVTGRMVSTFGHGSVESWRWIDVVIKRDGRWRIISTTQPN
jgi:hypothetical protein